MEDVVPASHNCEEPIISRSEWQVLSVLDGGYLSIMDANANIRDDMKLPDENENDEEVAKRITEGVEEGKNIFVTILNSMGYEKVIDAQEKNN